jgi:hypothetical protein
MSKQKKARKERRPNVVTTVNMPMPAGQGGGAEFPRTPAVERKTTSTVFDYSYVKKDLTRIGILAGSFIAVFIVLSFFLNR